MGADKYTWPKSAGLAGANVGSARELAFHKNRPTRKIPGVRIIFHSGAVERRIAARVAEKFDAMKKDGLDNNDFADILKP